MTAPTSRPSPKASESLVSGTRWTAAAQVGTQAARLLTQLVLARLLVPSDLGLMAMAFVATGVVEIFTDFGSGQAVIQRRELSPALLNTLFLFNVGIGLASGVLLLTFANPGAALLGDADVAPVLRVTAFTVFANSLVVVHRALLVRAMRFDVLAKVDVSSALLNAAAAIPFARAGFGVWALVAGFVASTFGSVVAVWLVSRWRPRIEFSSVALAGVWSFSWNLLAFNAVSYCLRNADKLIVGRALGTTDLGYYSFAQRMADYPAKLVADVLTPVMLPALSRLQDDDDAMRRSILRAAGGTALLTFPLVGGCLVVARPTADFLFGARWAPAVPLFMVMVLAGAATSLSYALSTVYRAKGRTDWLFRWGSVRGLLAMSGSVLGVSWGVTGVAVAGTVVTGLCTYPSLAIPLHLVGLKVASLLRRVRRAGIATIIMVAGVLALRGVLEWMAWPSVAVAGSCALLGIVIYAEAIRRLKPPEVEDLLRLAGPLGGALARILRERAPEQSVR